MGLIAKSEGNDVPKLEDGVYPAIATRLIDLGYQENTKYNKTQRKIMITWELLGQTININNQELPRVMSKEYTLSLGEKSTLRRDLQAWRGKAFTAEELEGFDLVNVLGKNCQLQIITSDRNGKSYTDIAAIMAMPKGMTVSDSTESTVYFNTYEPETFQSFAKIPKWIQDKIRRCTNIDKAGLDIFIASYDEAQLNNAQNNNTQTSSQGVATNQSTTNTSEIPDDDLPF